MEKRTPFSKFWFSIGENAETECRGILHVFLSDDELYDERRDEITFFSFNFYTVTCWMSFRILRNAGINLVMLIQYAVISVWVNSVTSGTFQSGVFRCPSAVKTIAKHLLQYRMDVKGLSKGLKFSP